MICNGQSVVSIGFDFVYSVYSCAKISIHIYRYLIHERWHSGWHWSDISFSEFSLSLSPEGLGWAKKHSWMPPWSRRKKMCSPMQIEIQDQTSGSNFSSTTSLKLYLGLADFDGSPFFLDNPSRSQFISIIVASCLQRILTASSHEFTTASGPSLSTVRLFSFPDF